MQVLRYEVHSRSPERDGFYAVCDRTRGQQKRDDDSENITYRLLEVCDEVVAVLLLLETSERHLCSGDVLSRNKSRVSSVLTCVRSASTAHLLWVLEVLEESLLLPNDPLVHVRGRVRVVLCLTGLAAEETGRVVSTPDVAR